VARGEVVVRILEARRGVGVGIEHERLAVHARGAFFERLGRAAAGGGETDKTRRERVSRSQKDCSSFGYHALSPGGF